MVKVGQFAIMGRVDSSPHGSDCCIVSFPAQKPRHKETVLHMRRCKARVPTHFDRKHRPRMCVITPYPEVNDTRLERPHSREVKVKSIIYLQTAARPHWMSDTSDTEEYYPITLLPQVLLYTPQKRKVRTPSCPVNNSTGREETKVGQTRCGHTVLGTLGRSPHQKIENMMIF